MKRKISAGRLLCMIGLCIIALGLILRAFGLLPVRVISCALIFGLLIDAAALIVILKRSEF